MGTYEEHCSFFVLGVKRRWWVSLKNDPERNRLVNRTRPWRVRRLTNDQIGGAGVTGFNQQLAAAPGLATAARSSADSLSALALPPLIKATHTAALYRSGVFVVWGRGRPLSRRNVDDRLRELARVSAALGVAIHCLGSRMPGSAPNSGEGVLRMRMLRSS